MNEILNNHPATFEEGLPVLDMELKKRKSKWALSALPAMSYEDVEQVVRMHIAKKFFMYDSSRPYAPWVNRIISSQVKNILRNVYYSFERPCLRCKASIDGTHCSMTPSREQCSECPLYKKWASSKKNAHDIRLAVSMENHQNEVNSKFDDHYDTEANIKKLNIKLKEQLKPNEWLVYSLLYIENKELEEVAKIMGFSCSETDRNRKTRYKRIQQIRINVIAKTKKILEEGLD